jgi:hypothetical protein
MFCSYIKACICNSMLYCPHCLTTADNILLYFTMCRSCNRGSEWTARFSCRGYQPMPLRP